MNNFEENIVFCVMCLDDDNKIECVHIFSTIEKAEAFCTSDDRCHVIYNYLIDCPSRMEERLQ